MKVIVLPIASADKSAVFTTEGVEAIVGVVNGNVVFVDGILAWLENYFLATYNNGSNIYDWMANINLWASHDFASAKNKIQKNSGVTDVPDEDVCVFLTVLNHLKDSDGKKLFNVDENGNVSRGTGSWNDARAIGDIVPGAGNSYS